MHERVKLSLLVLLAMVILETRSGAGEKEKDIACWTYRTDRSQGFARPVLQAIQLSGDLPDNVKQKVTYRGHRQRYAQIRYGSENSTRAIVVVDEVSRSEFDLYLDRSRNRIIEEGDLAEGTARLRTTSLDVETMHDEVETSHVPRVVMFRRGVTGRTLSFATVGFVEGTAQLGERQVAVRRVDGDGNGLFSDARDRLWIDLNDDGQWDPFSEQFPFMPVLRLGERRFSVRADRVGQRLAFEDLVGTGRIKVELPPAKDANVKQLDVMLIGEDGAALSLRGNDWVSVPIGRYALGTVSLAVLDRKTPDPWHFVFSRSGGDKPQRWYEVRKDEEVVIDPIGTFRFELKVSEVICRPGQSLRISPRLFTGDGLLINSSSRGEVDRFASKDRYNCSSIQLLSSDNKILGTTQSGFA